MSGEVILPNFPGFKAGRHLDTAGITRSAPPNMDKRYQLHLRISNLRPVCALHIGRYDRILCYEKEVHSRAMDLKKFMSIPIRKFK